MSIAVQVALVMVVLLVAMLAAGVPIGVSIGLASAISMICMLPPDIAFATSAQRIFAGSNSFSLIAIPFFILAGNIMNNWGIALKLVNCTKVLSGRKCFHIRSVYGRICSGHSLGTWNNHSGRAHREKTGIYQRGSGYLSLFYGSMKPKDIPKIVLESARITGTITFMIGLSSIMSWAMAFTGIPDMVASAVLGVTDNRIVIFLLINVILLVVGTFMDPTPAILIFTPIFLPICISLGMNPVQFGIVLCMNLSVGTITPPVGTILFIGCKIGGVTIESVMKHRRIIEK